jgi:hypothetical protein
MTVNQALRKQTFDLARYTDGEVPAGIFQVPLDTEWTTQDIMEYEQKFNEFLTGNAQQRVRVKVAPPGFTFVPTHPQEPNTDFDRWLLNLTAACFGLTMAELGMTEQVNKSSGATQENVVYRRAVRPLADFFARYLSRIIAEEFDPRYRLTWTGFEVPEDFATKAHALAELVQSGIIRPDQAAGMLRIEGLDGNTKGKKGHEGLDTEVTERHGTAITEPRAGGFRGGTPFRRGCNRPRPMRPAYPEQTWF